jgi:hypothetical protein
MIKEGVYYCDKTNGVYILTDIEQGTFENGPAAIVTYESDLGFWKKVLIGQEIINDYIFLGEF